MAPTKNNLGSGAAFTALINQIARRFKDREEEEEIL